MVGRPAARRQMRRSDFVRIQSDLFKFDRVLRPSLYPALPSAPGDATLDPSLSALATTPRGDGSSTPSFGRRGLCAVGAAPSPSPPRVSFAPSPAPSSAPSPAPYVPPARRQSPSGTTRADDGARKCGRIYKDPNGVRRVCQARLRDGRRKCHKKHDDGRDDDPPSSFRTSLDAGWGSLDAARDDWTVDPLADAPAPASDLPPAPVADDAPAFDDVPAAGFEHT